jgi:hypothetical protein
MAQFKALALSLTFAMSAVASFAPEARAESANLTCTVDRLAGKPVAADTFTIQVDYGAKLATWNGQTRPIKETLNDTFLLLGWSPRSAVLNRDTGKFGFDVKADDGTRWYARSSTCRAS